MLNCSQASQKTTETYSHSRLATYEKCPYQYKLKYIDRLEVEERKGIEAFTGNVVHESLEHLYSQAKEGTVVPWEELVTRLRSRWDDLIDDSVVVIRKDMSVRDFLLNAQNMLMSYYQRHQPFDDSSTVGLEHELCFTISGASEHEIRGFIDRLSCRDGVYEIHDYKTGKRLPSLQSLRQDRQLALYEIGVRRTVPDVEKVELVWHYLAHDRELRCTRSASELKELERCTASLIEEIEVCEQFPKKMSGLCQWCEYIEVCNGCPDGAY